MRTTSQKAKIGIFLAKYRIENGLTQKEMADSINIMPSNLSAIEYGRISIPANFRDRLINAYVFTPEQINEINKIIEESANDVAHHAYRYRNNIYLWVKNTCGILNDNQRRNFFDAVKKVESEYYDYSECSEQLEQSEYSEAE